MQQRDAIRRVLARLEPVVRGDDEPLNIWYTRMDRESALYRRLTPLLAALAALEVESE